MDLGEIVNTGYSLEGSSKLSFGGGLVFQVTNVRNISAPKANQEAKTSPRLMLIDLSDGKTYYPCLEFDPLPTLNIDIAPGTKILIQNDVKVVQGMISLLPHNVTILGGKVTAMYEKWQSNRMQAKILSLGAKQNVTEQNGRGPPPWIPFGQKKRQSAANDNDKTFKTFDAQIGEKKKHLSEENEKFSSARNEAIAEANKNGFKKIFGGGNRQLMDHNVKKILEKGYTEEQAKHALKLARNNLERAMNNLKRRDPTELLESYGKDRSMIHQERARGSRINKTEVAVTTKPSGKVSLFDYLEDKIKISEYTTQGTFPANKVTANKLSKNGTSCSSMRPHSSNTTDSTVNTGYVSKFENDFSSSFLGRHRKEDNNYSLPMQLSIQNTIPHSPNFRSTKNGGASGTSSKTQQHLLHHPQSDKNAQSTQCANSTFDPRYVKFHLTCILGIPNQTIIE